MSLESFFKDKDALLLVDGLAQRYKRTPFEILTCQTLYEFNFNATVMLGAMEIEKELKKEAIAEYKAGAGEKEGKAGKEETTLKDFGIKHTIHKKAKD